MATIKLRAVRGDQAASVDLQGLLETNSFSARVNGDADEYEVVTTGTNSGFVRQKENIAAFRFARTGDRVQVWLGGRTYEFEAQGADRRRQSAAQAANEEIVAPMPGTILRINARNGDLFEPHQPLIIMESMKMEIALSSPANGKIGAILCAVGELVPLGKTLARLQFDVKT